MKYYCISSKSSNSSDRKNNSGRQTRPRAKTSTVMNEFCHDQVPPVARASARQLPEDQIEPIVRHPSRDIIFFDEKINFHHVFSVSIDQESSCKIASRNRNRHLRGEKWIGENSSCFVGSQLFVWYCCTNSRTDSAPFLLLVGMR